MLKELFFKIYDKKIIKMFNTLFIVVLIALSSNLYSDEPPSFVGYEEYSPNKKYVAKIKKEGEEFFLTVYKKEGDKFKKIWKCEYLHHGYFGGILTDDGQYFVYISAYFYMDDFPLISIYKNGSLVKKIYGNELEVYLSDIKKSESHYVWVENQRYIVKKINNNYTIRINLVGGKDMIIDLDSLEINYEKTKDKKSEEKGKYSKFIIAYKDCNINDLIDEVSISIENNRKIFEENNVFFMYHREPGICGYRLGNGEKVKEILRPLEPIELYKACKAFFPGFK